MAEQESCGPKPGERILWEGRSARGLTLDAFDGPLMAAGAMLIVIGSGLIADAQWAIGCAVLLLGAYLLAGQLLIESQRRHHTRYVLTPDRAYLIGSWPRPSAIAVDLRRCGPMILTRHRDGTGTITFGRSRVLVAWIGPIRWARPAFRYVRDADLLILVARGEADSMEDALDEVSGADPS